VRVLYQEHAIQDLPGLKAALEAGELNGIPGIGPKNVEEHPRASQEYGRCLSKSHH
jgi:DNA polymerase/3'-5' exonuclease PolX